MVKLPLRPMWPASLLLPHCLIVVKYCCRWWSVGRLQNGFMSAGKNICARHMFFLVQIYWLSRRIWKNYCKAKGNRFFSWNSFSMSLFIFVSSSVFLSQWILILSAHCWKPGLILVVKGGVLLDTKDFTIYLSYNSSQIPDWNSDHIKKGDLNAGNSEKPEKYEEC